MKHTRPFIDPLRPRFKGLSDQARDNYDRIFGERPLPNEKDHLESYVRLSSGERFDVGSANQPIVTYGALSEPIEREVVTEEEHEKRIISAPGKVHRIDLNELPAGVSLKDLFEKALEESEDGTSCNAE